MSDPTLVAVEATQARYRVLTHLPSGADLDAEGRGQWPADSFTYRLRDEGAIRLVPVASDAPPAPIPAAPEADATAKE